MPHKANWEEEGIYWEFFGKVDAEEMISCNRELCLDPRCNNIRYEILDFTDVTETPVNQEDLQSIAAINFGSSFYLLNLRIALIAPQAKMKGLCNAYITEFKKLGTPWEITIVDDLRQARCWLEDNSS